MRVGIVGCDGKMGKRHAQIYDKLNVDWIGCDADKKYITYEEMLDDCNIDIVDICTPTSMHYDMVMKALDAEKHVFCEKPLTPIVTEVKDIVALSELVEKSCMVGYLYRFHPVYQILKQYNDGELFGDVYYVFMRLGVKGADKMWKYNDRCGGAGYEMVSHLLDLTLWIFGDDDFALTTLEDRLIPKRVIDGEEIEIKEEDYKMVDGTGDRYKMLLIGDLSTPMYNNVVEVHGDKGSYIGTILPDVPTRIRIDDKQRMVHFGYVDMLYEELKYFIERVEKGEIVRDGLETAERIADILGRW